MIDLWIRWRECDLATAMTELAGMQLQLEARLVSLRMATHSRSLDQPGSSSATKEAVFLEERLPSSTSFGFDGPQRAHECPRYWIGARFTGAGAQVGR